jgi:hypothetical protein
MQWVNMSDTNQFVYFMLSVYFWRTLVAEMNTRRTTIHKSVVGTND